MRISTGDGSDEFEVRITRNELQLLSNALNEAYNGIEVWEFSTRLGSKRDDALRMMEVISKAIE